MGLNLKIPFIIIELLVIVHVNAEDLGTENNISDIDDANKTTATKLEYGCEPPSDWKLMYPALTSPDKEPRRELPVKNVCLENAYDPTILPLASEIKELALDGTNIKRVYERKHRVAVELRLSIRWQDPRIKSKFGENSTTLKLPSITRERKSMLSKFHMRRTLIG